MQEQQCIDGEWSSALPVCKLIQEAPKPECEKALVSRWLVSILFTAGSPGPGITPGICSVYICLMWDILFLNGLALAWLEKGLTNY